MKSRKALDAIFAGPVSLEDRAFDRLSSVVIPGLHADVVRVVVEAVSGNSSGRPSSTFSKKNGVATIAVYGIIVANEDPDNEYYGLISCERIRSDIQAAIDDDEVFEIVLKVCSPGGSVIGLEQTAAAIRASSKPVATYSDGMMCSAAYFLGAQADEVCVANDSLNGSIGVYSTASDYSRMYDNAGIKVEVIRAGALKGAGTFGTPITPEQRAEKQKIVDAYYNKFVDAVASGREMPREKALALADGSVHIGAAGVTAGLADSTDTFDALHARLSARAQQKSSVRANGLPSQKGVQAMSSEEEKKAKDEAIAAERKRSADITAAFPKHAAFANKMIADGKSLIEAQAAFNAVLVEEAQAKDAEIATLKASKNGAGNPVIPTAVGKLDAGGAGDAKEQFNAKVDALVVKGVQKSVAVQRVAKQHPELHRAMISAANPGVKVEEAAVFAN